MAVKTVVNEIDGFYIMANRNLDLEYLARKTRIKKEIIRAYIDKNIDTSTTQPAVQAENVTDRAYQAMARNKERGVTIMTPAASEIGDSVRVSQKQVVDNSAYVHKIRKN